MNIEQQPHGGVGKEMVHNDKLARVLTLPTTELQSTLDGLRRRITDIAKSDSDTSSMLYPVELVTRHVTGRPIKVDGISMSHQSATGTFYDPQARGPWNISYASHEGQGDDSSGDIYMVALEDPDGSQYEVHIYPGQTEDVTDASSSMLTQHSLMRVVVSNPPETLVNTLNNVTQGPEQDVLLARMTIAHLIGITDRIATESNGGSIKPTNPEVFPEETGRSSALHTVKW